MPYYLVTWKNTNGKPHSVIRNNIDACILETMFLTNSSYDAFDVEYTLVTENW